MTKRSGNWTERCGSSVFAPGIQPMRSVPPCTGVWAEAPVAPASSTRPTTTATCLVFIVRPPASAGPSDPHPLGPVEDDAVADLREGRQVPAQPPDVGDGEVAREVAPGGPAVGDADLEEVEARLVVVDEVAGLEHRDRVLHLAQGQRVVTLGPPRRPRPADLDRPVVQRQEVPDLRAGPRRLVVEQDAGNDDTLDLELDPRHGRSYTLPAGAASRGRACARSKAAQAASDAAARPTPSTTNVAGKPARSARKPTGGPTTTKASRKSAALRERTAARSPGGASDWSAAARIGPWSPRSVMRTR